MSTELAFLNFCISMHKRLGPIIEKWQKSKKMEVMDVDDEKMMAMIYTIFWNGKYQFGNDNRNPGEIIEGE